MNNMPLVLAMPVALVFGLVAYFRTLRRSGDPRRAMVWGVVIFAAAAACGQPLARMVLETPQRLIERKRLAVEKELSGHPAFQAIRQHDPEAFRNAVLTLATAPAYRELKPGSPAWNMAVRSTLEREMRRYIHKASDQAVLDYAWAILEASKSFPAPEVCHAYLRGQAIDGPAILSGDLLQSEAAADAAIIASAAASPQPEPKREAGEAALEPVFRSLAAEYGGDWQIFQYPASAEANKDLYCRVTRSLLEQAVRLPDPDRALGLRYVLTPHG